ncbi:hypothetical protein GCM10029963_51210 [Micromonospora andamanensis]|uniref:DUF6527 family protein n=1 Tax=Micromonospora andamanensis TaxID=1287068 RepID=UPI001951B7F5|nr:DUF6527 family protein [Micromonospora andamanensis]GIJ37551.1 hypothetical protein Vwe01_08760 [Micromonospora andamanensis]
MTRLAAVRHEFVEYIPAHLEDGVIYISIEYATVVHACCCGCGQKVVTPLHPAQWRLTFDGESISLDPSVGSWNLACSSHYWIKRNRVQWARAWSQDEIKAGRRRDRLVLQRDIDDTLPSDVGDLATQMPHRLQWLKSVLRRILPW